jgi:hypothetical protein
MPIAVFSDGDKLPQTQKSAIGNQKSEMNELTQATPHRTIAIHVLIVFVLALGVRFLTWQDNRRDIGKVQTAVTEGYKDSANQLLRGETGRFLNDVNHLGHPPGYPLVIAVLTNLFGSSDSALQWLQIIADSLAVALLYLIALKLLPLSVALLSGLLAAVSPQFAYFSVLLLPDSLIVLPILTAVYFLLRARSGSVINYVVAGCLIGVSCWLRANALFLAPFLALCTPLFVTRGNRIRAGLLIIAGAVLVISPITIKNAIVFRQFVPVSLGAGQTLLEGIADYDDKGVFNIPITDLGIMKQEAAWSGRPEYAQWLFGVDGIERDRKRVARGLSVIKSHPVWFASVMTRRAIASTRLDPVPVLLRESPVASDVNSVVQLSPARVMSSTELATTAVQSPGVTTNEFIDQLLIKGNGENYGDQLVSQSIPVRPGYDYAVVGQVKLNAGRVLLKVTGANRKLLASQVVELSEVFALDQQPVQQVSIPFVSGSNSQVYFAVAHNAAANSEVQLNALEVFELGPSSGGWLRYVRMPLGVVQQIFKSAFMLPLVVFGLVILVARRQLQTLAFLLLVPAYYLIVQSTLHTERRYVYVIHFFFSIIASVTIYWLYELAKNGVRKFSPPRS